MSDDTPPSQEAPDCTSPATRADLTALIDDYADRLVHYAFRQVGNVQDAEDIVQDVFAKVVSIDRQHPVVSIGPYLYRAVGNGCTDFLRRRLRSPIAWAEVDFEEVSTASAGPLEAAEAAEEFRRTEAILSGLPPEQADVVRLRVFDGLRLDEIADILDCSINTVSSRLRYGFQKLRAEVGKTRSML